MNRQEINELRLALESNDFDKASQLLSGVPFEKADRILCRVTFENRKFGGRPYLGLQYDNIPLLNAVVLWVSRWQEMSEAPGGLVIGVALDRASGKTYLAAPAAESQCVD